MDSFVGLLLAPLFGVVFLYAALMYPFYAPRLYLAIFKRRSNIEGTIPASDISAWELATAYLVTAILTASSSPFVIFPIGLLVAMNSIIAPWWPLVLLVVMFWESFLIDLRRLRLGLPLLAVHRDGRPIPKGGWAHEPILESMRDQRREA